MAGPRGRETGRRCVVQHGRLGALRAIGNRISNHLGQATCAALAVAMGVLTATVDDSERQDRGSAGVGDSQPSLSLGRQMIIVPAAEWLAGKS